MTKHEGFIWKKQFRPAEGATRHRPSFTTSGVGLLNKGCTVTQWAHLCRLCPGSPRWGAAEAGGCHRPAAPYELPAGRLRLHLCKRNYMIWRCKSFDLECAFTLMLLYEQRHRTCTHFKSCVCFLQMFCFIIEIFLLFFLACSTARKTWTHHDKQLHTVFNCVTYLWTNKQRGEAVWEYLPCSVTAVGGVFSMCCARSIKTW